MIFSTSELRLLLISNIYKIKILIMSIFFVFTIEEDTQIEYNKQ